MKPTSFFAYFVLFACVLSGLPPATADVTVNAPITLTRRVEIQPIRVKKVSGATVPGLGTAAEESYIKEQINRIWAQTGVRIDWLPFTEYVSDFAYDGSPGNYNSTPRPNNHLDMIVDGAPAPPKSSISTVVNMFFVETVPGFRHEDDNVSNGLAYVDGNGITVHVGRTLLTFTEGLDLIAGVIAHEIGHNLGLDHASASDNLMTPGNTAERLTTAQRTIVFEDDPGEDGFELLRPLVSGSNFSQWAAANGVTGGAAGDDDGDGLSNAVEFMFDLNPHRTSSLPDPVLSAQGVTWTLPKRQAALDDGLVYQVQTSANLQTWLSAGVNGSGSTIVQDNTTALIVRLGTQSARRFMRFNVDIPAGL